MWGRESFLRPQTNRIHFQVEVQVDTGKYLAGKYQQEGGIFIRAPSDGVQSLYLSLDIDKDCSSIIIKKL